MLWEQDRDDDDGLEQYVRKAIDANEITWFPLHKAIRLNQATTKEESLLNELVNKSKQSESQVASKLDKFQTDINTVLEQLNQTLKGDHAISQLGGSRSAASNRITRQSMRGAGAGARIEAVDQVSGQSIILFEKKQTKMLYANIREISGDLLRSEQYANSTIYCNVFFDKSMFTVHSTGSQDGIVSFPEREGICLVEGIECDDKRSVTFQLVAAIDDGGEDEELGLVEVPVNELFLAEGCYLDYFIYLDERESHLRLSITSYITLS
jgi:hypothetical protein